MENPATWGLAERVVSKVLNEQDNILPRLRPPSGQVKCGLSLARQITDALRDAGLLKEENEEESDEASRSGDDQADAADGDAAPAEVPDGALVR